MGFINTLKTVEVLDAHTVDVVSHNPDGLLLNRLAAFIVMVPPSYAQRGAEDLDKNPVGTGAFRFKSWKKDQEIELEANPFYWDSNIPRVEGLVFKFIPLENQVNEFLDGTLDILTNLPGTRTLEVERNPNTHVIKKPSFFTVAASFNTNRKPLSNKRIRQAVNKDDLIRYDLLGNGRPIAALSFPTEFGHNSRLKPYPFDPEKARIILKQ